MKSKLNVNRGQNVQQGRKTPYQRQAAEDESAIRFNSHHQR